MIHAGSFTTLVLAVLDGMIGLDSDCLIGDGSSNISAEIPQCPEVLNYAAQYCQCFSTTMKKTHRIIEEARNSSISFANTENLQDIEQAVLLVKEVLNTSSEISADIRNCKGTSHSCLLLYEEKRNRERNYTNAFHQLQTHLEMARTSENIVWYYMPPIITVVFICGMIGNCTLLFIFYKHPETRSGPKILLVNLAVSDVFLLMFHFFGKYSFRLFPFTLGQTACHIYIFLAIAPARASILSIMVLSITRYIAVSAMPGDRSHKLLDYMPVAVALVWAAASLQATLHTLESVIVKFDFSDKTHCDNRISVTGAILMINITCFLPFGVIGFFTFATYRRLRGDQKISGMTKLDKIKERNVKILPALAVLFTITYPPLYIFWLTAAINDFALSKTIIFFYNLTQFLININSALNPIVLYLSSEMFRDYFKKYLRLRCEKKQEQQQSPEFSSCQTSPTSCY